MSLIPEVKCRRCGETFSTLRSRCPNCGTRRVSQSSRVPNPTPGTVEGTEAYARSNANTKWQLVFGLVLIAAVILAVVVMVSTSLTDEDIASNQKVVYSMPVATEDQQLIETAPTPTPTPPPEVEYVKIMYYEKDLTDSDFSMRLSQGTDGDITLTGYAYPLTIENVEYKWSVDQEGVIEITPSADGQKLLVHQVGTIAGGVVITLECFGVTATTRCYATD